MSTTFYCLLLFHAFWKVYIFYRTVMSWCLESVFIGSSHLHILSILLANSSLSSSDHLRLIRILWSMRKVMVWVFLSKRMIEVDSLTKKKWTHVWIQMVWNKWKRWRKEKRKKGTEEKWIFRKGYICFAKWYYLCFGLCEMTDHMKVVKDVYFSKKIKYLIHPYTFISIYTFFSFSSSIIKIW